VIRAQHIVGNLDCELSWLEFASKDPELADLRVPVADRSLSREASRRIGPLATLLRALSTDDDAVLWTPFELDPACMVEVPGLPMPRIERGIDGAPENALEWGATRDVEAARIAARCNHRRFAFDLARDLSVQLDGSRWINDASEMHDALPTRWVVKAPLSAAGRDRVIGEGAPSRQQRERIQGLIQRQGPVLLEPWLERLIDLSCAGVVGDDEPLQWHLNAVDDQGRFSGIGIDHEGFNPPPPCTHAAERVREALRESGYHGSFGVDGYFIPTEDSASALNVNPLCEINARLTFGAVAHALIERVRPHLDDPPVILDLWTGHGAPPPRAITPLVLPTERSDTSAWLQDAMPTADELE